VVQPVIPSDEAIDFEQFSHAPQPLHIQQPSAYTAQLQIVAMPTYVGQHAQVDAGVAPPHITLPYAPLPQCPGNPVIDVSPPPITDIAMQDDFPTTQPSPQHSAQSPVESSMSPVATGPSSFDASESTKAEIPDREQDEVKATVETTKKSASSAPRRKPGSGYQMAKAKAIEVQAEASEASGPPPQSVVSPLESPQLVATSLAEEPPAVSPTLTPATEPQILTSTPAAQDSLGQLVAEICGEQLVDADVIMADDVQPTESQPDAAVSALGPIPDSPDERPDIALQAEASTPGFFGSPSPAVRENMTQAPNGSKLSELIPPFSAEALCESPQRQGEYLSCIRWRTVCIFARKEARAGRELSSVERSDLMLATVNEYVELCRKLGVMLPWDDDCPDSADNDQEEPMKEELQTSGVVPREAVEVCAAATSPELSSKPPTSISIPNPVQDSAKTISEMHRYYYEIPLGEEWDFARDFVSTCIGLGLELEQEELHAHVMQLRGLSFSVLTSHELTCRPVTSLSLRLVGSQGSELRPGLIRSQKPTPSHKSILSSELTPVIDVRPPSPLEPTSAYQGTSADATPLVQLTFPSKSTAEHEVTPVLERLSPKPVPFFQMLPPAKASSPPFVAGTPLLTPLPDCTPASPKDISDDSTIDVAIPSEVATRTSVDFTMSVCDNQSYPSSSRENSDVPSESMPRDDDWTAEDTAQLYADLDNLSPASSAPIETSSNGFYAANAACQQPWLDVNSCATQAPASGHYGQDRVCGTQPLQVDLPISLSTQYRDGSVAAHKSNLLVSNIYTYEDTQGDLSQQLVPTQQYPQAGSTSVSLTEEQMERASFFLRFLSDHCMPEATNELQKVADSPELAVCAFARKMPGLSVQDNEKLNQSGEYSQSSLESAVPEASGSDTSTSEAPPVTHGQLFQSWSDAAAATSKASIGPPIVTSSSTDSNDATQSADASGIADVTAPSAEGSLNEAQAPAVPRQIKALPRRTLRVVANAALPTDVVPTPASLLPSNAHDVEGPEAQNHTGSEAQADARSESQVAVESKAQGKKDPEDQAPRAMKPLPRRTKNSTPQTSSSSALPDSFFEACDPENNSKPDPYSSDSDADSDSNSLSSTSQHAPRQDSELYHEAKTWSEVPGVVPKGYRGYTVASSADSTPMSLGTEVVPRGFSAASSGIPTSTSLDTAVPLPGTPSQLVSSGSMGKGKDRAKETLVDPRWVSRYQQLVFDILLIS
jgi:hypothetical protein